MATVSQGLAITFSFYSIAFSQPPSRAGQVAKLRGNHIGQSRVEAKILPPSVSVCSGEAHQADPRLATGSWSFRDWLAPAGRDGCGGGGAKNEWGKET